MILLNFMNFKQQKSFIPRYIGNDNPARNIINFSWYA